MNSKYIVLVESKDILGTKAYGPFLVSELQKFLEKIDNKNITVLPLREAKEYGN